MSAPWFNDSIPARWYCVSRDGLAALCLNEANAQDMAAQCDRAYPRHAPHRAVLLGDVAAERERCATECERLAAEARAELEKQPEGSPARDRYFARHEALRTAAVELRLGA